MIDSLENKDYVSPEVVNLITQVGYKQRVGNYYVITEEDGYINISYTSYNNIEDIVFHKNFYNRQARNGNGVYKKDINKHFNNFLDFEKFIAKYHKKEVRKIKLKKIYDKI